MNTTTGIVVIDSFDWKIRRVMRSFLAALFKRRKTDWRSARVSSFYSQGMPVRCRESVADVLETEPDLKAPHKVQVCDLTKSEAEELLDCLENEHGPYLFVECTLGARGFTVSYLARRWRPKCRGELSWAREARRGKTGVRPHAPVFVASASDQRAEL
jgi:hypothetical protein